MATILSLIVTKKYRDYFRFSLFRMEPVGDNNLQHQQVQAFQYTDEQIIFLALEKEKGTPVHEIQAQFSDKWPGNAHPPVRNAIYKIWKKLKNEHTVKNLNKGQEKNRDI